MNILYIDTVTEWMVTGILEVQSGEVVRNSLIREKVPREGGIRLPLRIEEHLRTTGVKKPDRILTVHGPGSFTGIRIGITFSKTFAQVLDIPVIGLSSLEVYCMYYYNKYKERIVVLLDGRMKKVYGSAYSENGFEGCYDLPPDEAESKLNISNAKVFSNYPRKDSLDLGSDFPDPLYYIEKNNEKILGSSRDEYNWQNLTPFYMRGTYVDR